MKENKIGVLGCGWLGFPLAKNLIKQGFKVKGSTTNKEKIKSLEKENINPYLIEIGENKDSKSLDSFLEKLDILILNIPPKLRSNIKSNYFEKIRFIKNSKCFDKIKYIVFGSSTSVYGSKQGKINSKTEPIPDSKSGKEILKTEKLFQEKNNTIIRFGGLIGNKRNPLKYLQKKDEILNPQAPINYIHLNDCIGIINSIIEKNIWGKTFMGVSPYHPSKREYYDRLCNEKNLNKLNFSSKETIVNKEINDENILKLLNYKFRNPKF